MYIIFHQLFNLIKFVYNYSLIYLILFYAYVLAFSCKAANSAAPPNKRLNAPLFNDNTLTSDSAFTSAALGASFNNANSPKKSPDL